MKFIILHALCYAIISYFLPEILGLLYGFWLALGGYMVTRKFMGRWPETPEACVALLIQINFWPLFKQES
ncbi:MAG: hypothetical protein RSD49_18300 [Hafnia sp.]